MEALCLFAMLAVLLLLGVPVGTCLGVAGVITLWVFGLGVQMAGLNVISGIASFPLLAIPFFVLAGVIMEKAGIAARIATLFELLVGRRTGGLAMVAVLTCMFWGALSGSGPATTAAVGLILMAPMVRQGYDRSFAAATVADASSLSIIIPPSIAFIIYGNLAGVSVSALFLAGVLPGLVMGCGILAVAYVVSRRRGYRGTATRGPGESVGKALRESVWALLAPVIILGGIYAGVFTPTEAAVVAVVYSLLIATLVYRSLSWRSFVDVCVEATVMTSVIMFVVAFAGIFSWAASTTGVADRVAAALVRSSPNALLLVLGMNVMLLVLGMFLDAISICYLVVPIMLPVLSRLGLDPLWYGVVFVTALAIGQITPPVGVNLFTAANLSDESLDRVSRQVLPYLLVNIVALVVITLVPSISLWLPRLLGLHAAP